MFGKSKYSVEAAAGGYVRLAALAAIAGAAALAGAAGMAGCVENRVEDYDPAVELAFVPQWYVPVRSDIPASDAPSDTPTDAPSDTPTDAPSDPLQEECYPEALPFGVSAWLLPEGLSFADHAAEAQVFMARCEVACDGGEWRYEPPKEWSPKTTRLSFIGYAPYDAAAGCDAVQGVTFSDVDTSLDQTDLLYTDVVADRSKTESGGEVALPFRHALCKVSFRIKNLVAGDEKVAVRSITLDAAALRGSFRSLPEPVWQLDASRAPIRFFEGEAATDHTPCAAGRSVLMLPQELAAPVTVEYDYTASHGVVLHQRLSTKMITTRLEAGRHYVYTLSIGIDEVKFLLEVIENHFD